MTETTARFSHIAVPAALCMLLADAAIADAWTRRQGEVVVLVPVAYVVADESFDDNGDRVDREHFAMFEMSPYLEYGFTDTLTGGLQPKYRWVEIDTPTGEASNAGLAESDFFLRYRLWQSGESAFSVQTLVKAPLHPDEEDPAALGRDQVDAEINLLYGSRIPMDHGAFLYHADLGFRKRFDEPDDEVFANAYVGWSGPDSWSLILRSANTIGLGNSQGREVLASGPSFKRYEAQLIAGYQFNNTLSGSVGISNAYAGENSGVTNAGFVSLRTSF
jgi:hypothetical protein